MVFPSHIVRVKSRANPVMLYKHSRTDKTTKKNKIKNGQSIKENAKKKINCPLSSRLGSASGIILDIKNSWRGVFVMVSAL
tara:strand:+ start:185 stop:427 length:243 start_codon:yes stop_codon:yes gene_type:complete